VWYPLASDLNNKTFHVEDTMNAKRNWTQVALVVVLALTSLSSLAMSAPHRSRLNVLAVDLCGVTTVNHLDQQMTATRWVEQGQEMTSNLFPSAPAVNHLDQQMTATRWAEQG
jgi:hypothetical protein